jgi:hypothetical protein
MWIHFHFVTKLCSEPAHHKVWIQNDPGSAFVSSVYLWYPQCQSTPHPFSALHTVALKLLLCNFANYNYIVMLVASDQIHDIHGVKDFKIHMLFYYVHQMDLRRILPSSSALWRLSPSWLSSQSFSEDLAQPMVRFRVEPMIVE